jgi:polysaccharide export outer membrane protein
MSPGAFRRTLAGLALVLAALSAATAQEEYAIGPRDVLAVTVYGHQDLSSDYAVGQDGAMPFPLLGRVAAAGLTTRQLAAVLTERLEKDYLVNPHVMVTVKEYLSRKVLVIGEAERPGPYYLTGPTSVAEMLSKAGVGRAAGTQVVLLRERAGERGSVIRRLDLSKVLAGEASQNVRLEDQDTIFVPKAQAFFVLGEVKTAGTFPLDKEVTVFEAITLAGGFTDRAAPGEVKLIRRTPDGQQETIALDMSGGSATDRQTRLREGDTLYVPKGNTFFVFGEVKRPGAYTLDRDTNILEGVTIAGGFTERASPARARVIRNAPGGQQVLNVDMSEIVKRGQRDRVMLLQPGDVIVVPESFF